MAINLPIISEWNPKGIDKAIADFKKLETKGEKASFAIKKAAVPATLALAAMGSFLVNAAKGAPVAITDMAGKAGGTSSRREPKYRRPNFASALNRIGTPSRFMWKDIESMASDAERALQPIIQKFMDDAKKEFK